MTTVGVLSALCLLSCSACFSIHMYEGTRQSRKKLAHLDIDDDWIRPIAIDGTDAGLRKGFYLLSGEHLLDIELMRVVQGSREKHELRKLELAATCRVHVRVEAAEDYTLHADEGAAGWVVSMVDDGGEAVSIRSDCDPVDADAETAR